MSPRIRTLFAALLLAGCTTTKPGAVAYDENAKATVVTGKETTIEPLAGPEKTYFLKAETSAGATELYFVVLYLSVDGKLSAESVLDSEGQKIESLRGADEAFDVGYGRVTKEIYYVPLTRAYLESHRSSAITLRLQGPKGTLTATMPPDYVAGFLSALDATLHGSNSRRTGSL